MMRFAEELGQVGGDGVDHRQQLVLALGTVDEAAIGIETVEVEGAQPADQAAVDHLVLSRAELYAGARLDQRREEVEILGREVELAGAGGHGQSSIGNLRLRGLVDGTGLARLSHRPSQGRLRYTGHAAASR